MKKKSVIILGIIILAIIVLAIFIFAIFTPPKFSNESILKDPSAAMTFCQKTSGDKQSECYLQIVEVLALNNTDISVQACLAISDDGLKKQCINDLANKQNSPTEVVEICNKITDDNSFKQHCYGQIDTNSADLSVDTKLAACDVRPDKDMCYRGIADGLWETQPSIALEICKKISDSNTKNGCLNNFMGSPELIKANPAIAEEVCSSSSLMMKSNCYNNLAQTLSGIDPKQGTLICQKLSDDVQIFNCYQNAWFSFDSVILQNYDFAISACNVLELKKDDCLRRTSEVFSSSDKAKATAICNLMSTSASSGCLNNIPR
jgi:hypothetical protein